MRRFFIIFLLLFTFLFAVQQSRSAPCGGTCRDGNHQEMDDGEWYLYWSDNKYNNIDSCKNDNWSAWCCICEHPETTKFNYPPICIEQADQLTCPILSPSPSPDPTPSIPPTEAPTVAPTLPPINCQWSTWSTCSVTCGGGTQTRYHIVEAENGGNPCYGNYSQSCNTQECPRDCVWSAFGPCLKVGSGCAQTRTISIAAKHGGKECIGSTTQVCYACTDTNSTAVNTTGQGGIEITLYSGTNIGTSLSAPTPTQVQARNSGFNLFSRPTPTRIPPTPTHQPLVVAPTSIPMQEDLPQNPVIAPTDIPLPIPTIRPESIIPQSLASQTNSSGKVSYRLNTESLSEIKVSALTNVIPTESPFVPQGQRLLAKNTPSSGLMVALQQKTGSQFITQQDELTVKRGNQFFSITNQATVGTQGLPLTQQKKASDATKPSDAQLEINANNVIAFSSMGLSVDPLSGVLTVETPTGPQKVSIMPDEALGIIIELKALNTGLAEPSILLVSEQGKLIYRITGERMEKFLGLLPIVIQKQVLVSADTGSIIRIELSLLSKILSFFTF